MQFQNKSILIVSFNFGTFNTPTTDVILYKKNYLKVPNRRVLKVPKYS